MATPAPTAAQPGPGGGQGGAWSPEFTAYNKMVGDWLAAHPGQAFSAKETPDFWNNLFALGVNQQNLPQIAYENAFANVGNNVQVPYSALPGGPNYNAATFPIRPTDALSGNFPFAMPEAASAAAAPAAGTVPAGKPAGTPGEGGGAPAAAPEFLLRALTAPGFSDVIRKLFAA